MISGEKITGDNKKICLQKDDKNKQNTFKKYIMEEAEKKDKKKKSYF